MISTYEEDLTSSIDDDDTDSYGSPGYQHSEELSRNGGKTSSISKILEDDEKLFIPAKTKQNKRELACTPSGVLVNAKNVRKVCKKISHSLSDKTSQNKGACMFRKRTKRAEKFAIVGYGKQSVEESTSENTDGIIAKNSDIYTSSGEEDELRIQAYDYPNTHDAYVNENKFSFQARVRRPAVHDLDVELDSRSKGAILFAKRQKEMEKYLLESSCESGSRINDFGNLKKDYCFSDEDFFESDDENLSPISFRELPYQNSFSPTSFHLFDEANSCRNTVKPSFSPWYVNRPSSKLREETSSLKLEKNIDLYQSYEMGNRGYNSFTNQEKLSEMPTGYTDCQISPKHLQKGPHLYYPQRFVFRSFKPPTLKQKLTEKITKDAKDEKDQTEIGHEFASFVRKSTKGWSSVKFQPRLKADKTKPLVSDELTFHKCSNLPRPALLFQNNSEFGNDDALVEEGCKELYENTLHTLKVDPTPAHGCIQAITPPTQDQIDKKLFLESSSSKKNGFNKFGSVSKHFNRPIKLTDSETKPKNKEVKNTEKRVSACLLVLNKNTSIPQILKGNASSSRLHASTMSSKVSRKPLYSPIAQSSALLPEKRFLAASQGWIGLPSNLNDKKLNQDFRGKGGKMFAKQQQRMEKYIQDSWQGNCDPSKLQEAGEAKIIQNDFSDANLSHGDELTRTKRKQKPKIAPKPKLFQKKKGKPEPDAQKKDNVSSLQLSHAYTESETLQDNPEEVMDESSAPSLQLPDFITLNIDHTSTIDRTDPKSDGENQLNEFSQQHQTAGVSPIQQFSTFGSPSTPVAFRSPKPKFKAKSPVRIWQPLPLDE